MFWKMLNPSNAVPGGIPEDLAEFRDTCKKNCVHNQRFQFQIMGCSEALVL